MTNEMRTALEQQMLEIKKLEQLIKDLIQLGNYEDAEKTQKKVQRLKKQIDIAIHTED